jgi:hypothetical protein
MNRFQKFISKSDEKSITILDFGKYDGKKFEDLTKRQILTLLERKLDGKVIFTKYSEIYCNLHKFVDSKYPDLAENITLVCKCKK